MRLCLLASATAVFAAPAADRVASLPGWGAPLTPTFSGYLNIPGGKHIHYLFVASQGASSDPVVYWSNGGPGCSSLEGAFAESGPLWTTTGGATLQKNDYTWNKFSHNLFFEAPAGVGFSYADTPAGTTHDDTGTAVDSLAALNEWRKLFPEYADNGLWLTGESYAGVYIPMLAFNVYNYNTNQGGKIPLKGILVGNGCTGDEIGICSSNPNGDKYTLLQLHGHGFISDIAFDAAMAACGDWSSENSACRTAITKASHEAGNNFDIYDIYNGMFNTCEYVRSRKALRRPVAPSSLLGSILERMDAAAALTDNNCTNDDDLTTYMNKPEVQAALHVKAPSGGWGVCGGVNYNTNMHDETKQIYPTLVEKAGITIVIYNGEADNEAWTSHMGYPVRAPFKAWTASDGSLGGYITKYQPGGNSNFTYVTVRGAGHMVPSTQPLYAYDLAATYIKGGEL